MAPIKIAMLDVRKKPWGKQSISFSICRSGDVCQAYVLEREAELTPSGMILARDQELMMLSHNLHTRMVRRSSAKRRGPKVGINVAY